MPIRYLKKYAALEGQVTVEDAENLNNWLRLQARPAVNIGKCQHLHCAVLQVLLAVNPAVHGTPADPWLAQVLASAD